MTAESRTPGQQLKDAREALGKTTSELARLTRITVQQLQGLEDDNYERIPAPMYVRGFMKLYAAELGLDPEPLLEQYEAIRTGKPPETKPEVTVRAPKPTAPQPVVTPELEEEEYAEEVETPFSHPQRGIFSVPDPMARPKRFSFSMPSLPDLSGLDLQQYVSMDWLMNSWIPRIAGGVLLVLLLLIGVRGCGPEASPEPTPSSSAELPEIAEPLLREPGPVTFDLPRTLE